MRKKILALTLVLSLFLLLPACAAANKPVTNIEKFKEQVLTDWVALKNEPIKLPHEFDTFYYYGTDNGYHIILFRLAGAHTTDSISNSIAGYVFEQLGAGQQLMAYKNGEFTDLEIAHYYGYVSTEAIAKAAELHAERKNATE